MRGTAVEEGASCDRAGRARRPPGESMKRGLGARKKIDATKRPRPPAKGGEQGEVELLRRHRAWRENAGEHDAAQGDR